MSFLTKLGVDIRLLLVIPMQQLLTHPKDARFFEFDFAKDKKVSISLDEKILLLCIAQICLTVIKKVLKATGLNF